MRTTELLESYCPPDPDEVKTWAEDGQVDRILHDMLERGFPSPYEELPPEFLRRALEVVGQQGSDSVVAAAFNTMLSYAYSLVVRRLFFLERHLRLCHHPRCGEEIYSPYGLRVLDLYERAVEQFLRLVKAYAAASKSLELPDLAEILTGLEKAAPGEPLATSAATDDLPEEAVDGQAADVPIAADRKPMNRPTEDRATDTPEVAAPAKKAKKRPRPLRRSA